MSAPFRWMVTAAAVVAAAGAGLWAGQTGLVKLPMHTSRAVVAEPPQAQRKIIHYRNPMGLPDVSPVPKKNSMGMDYIPVYEGESEDGGAVKVSPGKIQRTGVKTEPVQRSLSRTIHAPGVVAIDERSVSVVAPRFDGFIDKVGPVTSGSHVKKGDPLMTVFGQELLNQAARLLVERYSGPSGDAGVTSARLKDNTSGVIGARRRLLNFGVPEEFIEQVERDRKVPRSHHLACPARWGGSRAQCRRRPGIQGGRCSVPHRRSLGGLGDGRCLRGGHWRAATGPTGQGDHPRPIPAASSTAASPWSTRT